MKNRTLVFSILIGLTVLYPLQRSIDSSTPVQQTAEMLYMSSGKTIKRMSFGLEALVADIYWIRTVQYFGQKILDSGKPISSGATKDIRMDLLAPLLKIVVTLDPKHITAYRFGAIFLPERDMQAAIALLENGVDENPNEWRLYQDLGYIYWQAGNAASGEEQALSYARSAEWFEKGGSVPNAPWWMSDLAGLMNIKGGSREAARAVYSTYLISDDQNVRAQAIDRLKQLRSLDELDAINTVLARYKEQTGSCPSDIRVLASRFRAVNLTVAQAELVPVDPDGFAYTYDPANCKAELASYSTVPR